MWYKLSILGILLCWACSSLRADTLHIYFPPDEAFLDHYIEKQIAAALSSIDGQKSIVLVGYADDKGDVYYNDMLSMRRAQSVAKYLDAKGFSEANVKQCIGKGEINRWDYEKSQRKADRRVDIVFSKAKPEVVPKGMSAPKRELLRFSYILFPNGLAVPEPASLPYLDTLYATMTKNKALKIEIGGHLCCPVEQVLDSSGTNMKLSENRAKMVYRHLLEKGIEPRRMTYKGFGGLFKIYNNPGGLHHELNRRVQIKVVEN